MSGPAGPDDGPPSLPELHMPTNDGNTGRYDDVWRASEPYMRARKNDVHIPLSFAFARKLLEAHPEADQDIVLAAEVGESAMEAARRNGVDNILAECGGS